VSVEVGEDFEATVEIRRLLKSQLDVTLVVAPWEWRALHAVGLSAKRRRFSSRGHVLAVGEPETATFITTSSFLRSVALPRRRLGDIGAVPRFHLLRGRML
jgi:hypothetical protein